VRGRIRMKSKLTQSQLTPKQTNHFRREPKMTTAEIIGNLENKAFHGSAASFHEKLTATEQIIIVGGA
jgi:hypothetical protein